MGAKVASSFQFIYLLHVSLSRMVVSPATSRPAVVPEEVQMVVPDLVSTTSTLAWRLSFTFPVICPVMGDLRTAVGPLNACNDKWRSFLLNSITTLSSRTLHFIREPLYVANLYSMPSANNTTMKPGKYLPSQGICATEAIRDAGAVC